jgi:hypothetical protein
MTLQTTHRRATALATFVATAGVATAAWAATGADPAPQPRPTATVIADLGAGSAAIDRAVTLAADHSGLSPADVVVRRTGSALEATADITELAATHPTAITATGPDARAALRQAAESELAPGTTWLTAR